MEYRQYIPYIATLSLLLTFLAVGMLALLEVASVLFLKPFLISGIVLSITLFILRRVSHLRVHNPDYTLLDLVLELVTLVTASVNILALLFTI